MGIRKNILTAAVIVAAITESFSIGSNMESIQQDLVAQRYKSAKESLQSLLRQNPDDISALYLDLAINQTEILDYESYSLDGKQFIEKADSIKNIIERKLPSLKGQDSVMCLFYLANVYGGISVMHAKVGEWIEGTKNGLTSVALLKKVKKVQPDFLAANLGVGLYNYYFGNSMSWIPFSGNKVEKGLNDVEIATRSEFPFNYAAKNSLCWILIDKEEFRRADSVAQSVLDDYPENTIFLRIRSMIDLYTGAYQKAISHANQLLTLSRERAPVNWSDMVAAYYIMVESYQKSGLINETVVAADTILNENIPPTFLTMPQIKKNLKRIRDIKEKLCEK
jgi:tetratricopeptide (TPR) repeat protein